MKQLMNRSTRYNSEKESSQNTCPVCGGNDFHEDEARGEKTCTACGCVVSSHIIDHGPEWRAFTAEERNARARTGAPMRLSIPDKGLSTSISWSNKDARGRSIKGKRRAAIYRMRKWQIRSIAHQSQHRNLRIAMRELDRLSSQMGIPRKAGETAALIYRKALNKRLIMGRRIESMVAASLYLSCRIHRIPRQLDEVVDETSIDRKALSKCVRRIIQNVDVHIPLPSARNLLPRISADLEMEGKTVQRASDIIRQAEKKGITAGKDPGGITAASLYIAGIIENDRRTQREIADASNVTEVTIRNRYKEIVRELGITANPRQYE